MLIDYEALKQAAEALKFECRLGYGAFGDNPVLATIICPNAAIVHNDDTYEWGPVRISVRHSKINVTVDRHLLDQHHGYRHPHASYGSGTICLGDAWSRQLLEAGRQGDWVQFLLAAYNSACSYNPAGAYRDARLPGPDQEEYCRACGEYYPHYLFAECEGCHAWVCENCIVEDNPGGCYVCLRTCWSCDEFTPVTELVSCRYCEWRHMCPECAQQNACACGVHYCPDCRSRHRADGVDDEPSCPQCSQECPTCAQWQKKENLFNCPACDYMVCPSCTQECDECGAEMCKGCSFLCNCATALCKDCALHCTYCRQTLCEACEDKCPACKNRLCGPCSMRTPCPACGQQSLFPAPEREPVDEMPF